MGQNNHIRDEIDSLEKQAGIYDKVENVRRNAQSLWRMITRIQEIYSSVEDQKLQNELIEKTNEWGCDEWAITRREVHEIERKLVAIRENEGTNWYLKAIVASLVFVAIGDVFFGVSGSIGGAIVGYFAGKGIQEATYRKKEKLISNATEELQRVFT